MPDQLDNCPAQYIPEQHDQNRDGVGDIYDLCLGKSSTGDADNDGLCAIHDCDDNVRQNGPPVACK
jgi:hypothetical protein